jgi:predicted enzyme related to lactoylglutathione lyase
MNPNSVTAVLPAENLERAKAFYTEKLGLSASEDIPGGIMFGEGNNRFFLYMAGAKSPGNFTQIGIEVPDVSGTVAELRGKGVVFEEYDMPDLKTENGVANTPAGDAAWFKDSEGNVIGIVAPPPG